MMNNLQIQRAQPSECALLSEIAMRSKAYWGYSAEFMEACRDELSYSPEELIEHDFFVAIDSAATKEPSIVGFYGLVQLSESVIELEALFIEPDQIGHGYGRRLYEHALLSAKQTGAKELVIQGDPNAKAFYLKVGGVLINEKESGSIPGRFLPLFSVDLT